MAQVAFPKSEHLGGSGKTIAIVVMAAGLSVAGIALYSHRTQSEVMRAEVRDRLESIADLKIQRISRWIGEHQRLGRAVQANKLALPVVARVANNQASDAERRAVTEWVESLRRNWNFSGAALLSASGTVTVQSGELLADMDHYREEVVAAVRSGEVRLHDAHRESPSKPVHMALSVPMRVEPDPEVFAVLVFAIDPNEYLFPLVQSWPVPSRSAETLIVRREGQEVVFLNELRHRKDTALKFRLPLSQTEIPAVQAGLGRVGVMEGQDYRGVPVLAAIRRVPDTDWFMVAKVDQEEVYAPIRKQAVFLAALVSAVLLALAAVFLFLRRRQQLQHLAELYQAELKQRTLQERFDLLRRAANDIILLIDEQGRIVEANDRACETYGYSREELQAMTIRDLRHEDDLANFPVHWTQSAQSGAVLFETVHKKRDGSPVPVEVSSRAVEVEGRMYRQSIIRDISERKAMSEQLRHAMELLRAVIDASPAAIVALRRDGTVTLWNAAAERIFGWIAGEISGRQAPFASSGGNEEYGELMLQVLGGAAVADVEMEWRRRDGSDVPLSISAAPLRDARGEISGAVMVSTDITERRAAERQRRLLSDTIAASLNEVYIFGADDFKFRYVNAGALRNLGYSFDEIRELTPLDLKPAISPEVFRELVAPLLSGEAPVRVFETEHRRKDGSLYPVEVHLQMFEHGGERVFLAMILDITERKRLEEERNELEQQLLQAQKMESIGRLAGGVAHDFNNHLTVINGYCMLLLRRLKEEDPLREPLEEIRKAGERAADLTRQLLAFSRKQVMEPKVVNLNSIVTDSDRMLRRLIGEDIEVVIALDASLGLVIADPGQLTQVLMNLAVNARDAMPAGGRLTIETQNVDLDETYAATHPNVEPGKYAMLSVSDTGVGMSQETMQRIFDPFFTTKPQGSGTGLGLAMVYGIVRQMGGWIWVYSELGKGTTFKVYFPLTDQEAENLVPVSDPLSVAGTETILVVEDNPEVRRLTVEILRGYGYTVLEADGGEDALHAAGQHTGSIDLMITDVVMPGMTGRELANRLKLIRPHVQVLYTSGYTANVIAHQGVLDPGVEYLPKPFTPVQLATKLRKILGPQRPPVA